MRRRTVLPARTRRSLTRAADIGARRLLPALDPADRRIVLCYHSVDPAPGPLSLTPALFDAHLAWLEAHAAVVALDELVADMGSGPRVAITFDDGYADNHAHALPLLAARGMTATFFVTAGFLERDDEVLRHLTSIWTTPRDQLRPLAWSQVRELQAADMAIGSHTWSHRNLARLTFDEAHEELRRSRAVIEERLGERVRAVAYPWGKLGRFVTSQTFLAARRAGYQLGGISLPRAVRAADDPLRLPRFGVGDEPVARLAAKVRGAIDWHASVHERMPPRVAELLFADA